MWTVRSSGTLMCLASGAAFGAMAVFGKLSYDEGATVGTLLVVRFGLAAVLFWLLLAARGSLREVRTLGRRDLGLALEHRELLGDGARRELERVGDRGDRAALVQLAQKPEPAQVEHRLGTLLLSVHVYESSVMLR